MNSAVTIIQAFEQACERWSEDIFIEDGSIHLSYAQTSAWVNNVAQHLMQLGINKGDRVALWCPNRYEWIVACLASHKIGCAVIPLNTRYKATEAAQILNASQCKVLFSIGHFLNIDYAALIQQEELPTLKHLIVIDESNAKCTPWKDLLIAPEHLHPFPEVSGDDVSDIIFTSGTTGKPKGVVTSHQQNVKAFSYFAELLGLDHSDRYLILNPFFHSFGYKAGILACIVSGARILPEATFDVDHILTRISRDKVSVMPGPPTIFQTLLAHPKLNAFDLHSLKKATTGAAVIPTQLIVDMKQILGIETVITAYGLSESCGLATMCRRGDAEELIASTSGRAIPEIEVAIKNENGDILAAGESGEIVIRGFNVMQEYLDNPAATQETIDADGWLHTGDIGVMNEKGYLKITDRLKDMYISGGFNCYPAEIESTINRHPNIVMCAVIGVADERLGEVGCLFYVTKGEPITQQSLHQWCRDHLANFKVPRHFIQRESLPMTASGKVHKPSLRAQWLQTQTHEEKNNDY